MSQVIGEISLHEVDPDLRGIDYKPLPPMAPAALVMGLASFLALFGLIGLGIAAVGVFVGFLATRQILASAGEYGGRVIAFTGLALSSGLFLTGSAMQVYAFQTEVPEGYKRLNFSADISKKEFVFSDGRWQLNPDVAALDGQQVFVKGYMYPTRQTQGLTSFVLVKDSDKCCFGGQPDVKDMILVEMADGLTADFHEANRVSVAGTFHTKAPDQGGDLKPVYEINATHFSRSRSAF